MQMQHIRIFFYFCVAISSIIALVGLLGWAQHGLTVDVWCRVFVFRCEKCQRIGVNLVQTLLIEWTSRQAWLAKSGMANNMTGHDGLNDRGGWRRRFYRRPSTSYMNRISTPASGRNGGTPLNQLRLTSRHETVLHTICHGKRF